MTTEDDKKPRCGRLTILIRKATADTEPLPPKGSRKTIWDRELKGFSLRVTSTGVKTYLLRYRMGGRETPIRTVTIGQHGSPWTAEQARRRAAELLTEVRSGRDIVVEREIDRAEAAIGRRSGSAANKAHKWLRQMFNWLIEQGDLEHSPVAKVKKPFP